MLIEKNLSSSTINMLANSRYVVWIFKFFFWINFIQHQSTVVRNKFFNINSKTFGKALAFNKMQKS